ncbi:P-loop containing nucleoside triphosphate hydrolase protein [Chytridium lagenaria]|nr:P-loop containing nucleoside triphosphate hydrolase protein [Chytridium lagenaria]
MDETPRKKLVVVGDGGCGKTALLTVFATGVFPSTYIPTVFETINKVFAVDGRTMEFALWDTAGQEEFERLRPLSYSESHIIVICFDITSRDSLENIAQKWYPEVNQYCHGVPIIVVGCKADARSKGQPNCVSYEEGRNAATRIGAKSYVECSAMENQNVAEVFLHAGRIVLAPAQKPAGNNAGGDNTGCSCTIL